MLNSKPLTKLVFFDIETIAKFPDWKSCPNKRLFNQQYEWLIETRAKEHYPEEKEACFNKAYEEVYSEKAHLTPEFGKIACISVGVILDNFNFKCLSFTGENCVKDFLDKTKFIHQDVNKIDQFIVGHNIKAFDIPFLCREILYKGYKMPALLEVGNFKPWELNYIIDTKEQLKFAGVESPSLDALCSLLSVETAYDKFGDPKLIKEAYNSSNWAKIAEYCEKDVYALAQCYLKLHRSNEYPTGITNQLNKI